VKKEYGGIRRNLDRVTFAFLSIKYWKILSLNQGSPFKQTLSLEVGNMEILRRKAWWSIERSI
jgi:hypothetical protein